MRSALNSIGLVAAIAGILAIVFVAASFYRDTGLTQTAEQNVPAPGSNTGAVMTDQSGGTAVVETLPREDNLETVEPGAETAAVEGDPADNDAGTDGGADGGTVDVAETSDQPTKETTTAPTPDIPDLDLVRVEPSGDAVFAGRSEPGWTVELRNGDDIVAKTEGTETGEWVITLDKPLDPGATELSLHSTSPDGSTSVHAPDNVTVVIDSARNETPLVVVSDPDSPSAVLQTPEPSEPPKPLERPSTQTALAETDESSDDADAGVVAEAVDEASEVVENPDAETAGTQETDIAREVPVTGDASSEATVDTDVATAPVQPEDAVENEPATGDEVAETNGSDVTDGEVAVEETLDETEEIVSDVGSETVDDPSEPTSIETRDVAAVENSDAADTSDQASSGAEELASTETITGDGEPTASEDGDQLAALTDPAASEEIKEPKPIEVPQVAIETVETNDDGTLFVTGRAQPGEQVRAYGNNEELGIGTAGDDGRWSVRSGNDTGTRRELTIRADAINSNNGIPTSRVEVTFSRPEPGETVIALMPIPTSRAQSDDESFDRLIVRKGDNLWTIARQIYGEGLRFTTIYQANANQIGDPDLIYPGQVFAIPKGILPDQIVQ
ncbi:MAG: LysM peptidoglycan-binding domain-containing protein [Pseudomonadota bacterium]